jgi:hypothetical protein
MKTPRPIFIDGVAVGHFTLTEDTVKELERLMQVKFLNLDTEPFVVAATFSTNIDTVTCKLISLDIFRKTNESQRTD